MLQRGLMNLDELSDDLKNHIFISKSEEQKDIISFNWERIRGLIAQNAGLGGWGAHLEKKDFEALKKNADETVQSIECQKISEVFNQSVKDLPGINYLFFNKIDKGHYT